MRIVDAQTGHSAYNVVIDIVNPLVAATRTDPRVAVVDQFLLGYEKSVETVANTIFPQALYRYYGAPTFFEIFRNDVLKKVRKNSRWSGYYFERMIEYPVPAGTPPNQIWDIVQRLKTVNANNKFELSLFDPVRDVDNSPYGGQCLSFLSFKVIPGAQKKLCLTAMYRNHYYVEKLLGNLIGLGRLMGFVAAEADLEVGSLTVVSTHAEIDQPENKEKAKRAKRSDIEDLIARFDIAASRHEQNKGSFDSLVSLDA
jgi:hypothetical protein